MHRLLAFIKTNWVTFTLINFALVTVLSLSPLKTLPTVPGSDKTYHLIAYAALMFPIALRKPRKWVMFALVLIAYSGAIELLQPYVNRYGEWADMAANTAGVVCGSIIAALTNHFFPVIINHTQ